MARSGLWALLVAGLLAGPVSGPVSGHQITVGTMEIIHPMIPAPPRLAKAAAAYMGIANNGSEPDRLLGVETGAAQKAQVHDSQVAADGVARMVPVPALDIPAGDTVLLQPGGLHVMLLGLTGALAEGDMVPAVLVFEKAGRVPIEFMVDPPEGEGGHAGMDHSQHKP